MHQMSIVITKVMLFCLCLLLAALMVAIASPALSSFHISQLSNQANFPDVGTLCRDRARAAHKSQALSLSAVNAAIPLPLLFHHPRKLPSLPIPKTNPVFSDLLFCAMQCGAEGSGSAHDMFSTRPVALNVIVPQSCCCSAITWGPPTSRSRSQM